MAPLSKSKIRNMITISILGVWLTMLLTSITPINVITVAAVRDLVEAVLEIVEKIVYFIGATTTSSHARLMMFVTTALFAVAKKILEIYVDPAPERKVNGSWAFVGAVVAKLVEYVVYAVRFEPASRAWRFWVRGAGSHRQDVSWLSEEQLARRHLWARNYFKEQLQTEYGNFMERLSRGRQYT